jgi:excisionase family DNA binding protein
VQLAQETDTNGDKLLSIGKAADLLGVSVGTLRAWADKGLVHAIRLPSGYRRFTRGEIDEMRRQMGYEE